MQIFIVDFALLWFTEFIGNPRIYGRFIELARWVKSTFDFGALAGFYPLVGESLGL